MTKRHLLLGLILLIFDDLIEYRKSKRNRKKDKS